MRIVVFTAEKFGFEDEHIKKIVSAFPFVNVAVAGSDEELLKLLPEAEILVCGNYNYRPSWLTHAKRLKWIHSIAAGNEKILPSLIDKQIMLTDSSGVHAMPIAEQVVGYMLMFERKLLSAFKMQQRKEWAQGLEVGELLGKAVLIVGLGSVGKGIAGLCKCLGMKVIATKREASAAAIAEVKSLVDELHPTTNLAKLIPLADYVVLSLPFTKETRHMFGSKELAAMKPTAYLINIARGGIVDEAALIAALMGKKIAGAALDVFEQEPLPKESPLWEMENVIITPHNAGLTPYYIDRVVGIFCTNLKAYLENKPEEMPNLVDKVKGY